MPTVSSNKQDFDLGDFCQFSIQMKDDLEFRFYITHRNTFYLKPVTDWIKCDNFVFYPESPGKYKLSLQWRNIKSGETNWVFHHFEVHSGETLKVTPTYFEFEDFTVLASSQWEAGIFQGCEEHVKNFMKKSVSPGWTAYDIGANIGVYSLLLSRLVGRHGSVVSIEANPVCVYFLQINIENNKIENCTIYPFAVSDNEKDIPFTINYGNTNLGISNDSSFYGSKVGHEITVHSNGIDNLLRLVQINKPDFIKIDVEGVEGTVIQGLKHTMEYYRPHMMIEVHGLSAARETFTRFSDAYEFVDLQTLQRYESARKLLDSFPETVLQIGCIPK